MDGTDFNFEALCLSVTKMVIINMILEWVQMQMHERYPPDLENNPTLFQQVLREYKEEITESIWNRYDEIYAGVKRQLELSMGVHKGTPVN